MKREIKKNFDILANFAFYVPGVADTFILLAWLVAGALLGNIVTLLFVALMGNVEMASIYATVIAYPLMFIPAMMYAGYKSMSNSAFEVGYKLDNNHFAPLGAVFCVILCVAGTLAASFVSEPAISFLPEMPDFLETALHNMTQGPLLVNLLCVSIFAPLFEEWLCRGMVLRGLLNTPVKRKDGSVSKGLKPVWAIVISAAFFALIHLNPWQAIPAFILGCLFGYVYYKTGSLKLTMLMHFTNNTFAVVVSNIDKFKDVESWRDVLPPALFWALFAFCIAMVLYVVSKFRSVASLSAQGSCDKVND